MPVALLIGVGGNVGRAAVSSFAAAGYGVAIASRNERFDSSKYSFFKFDAEEPASLPEVFKRVHAEVGIPSVVVYNAYATAPKMDSVAEVDSVEKVQKRLNVNTVSPVVAADEAIKGFLKLEAEGKLGPEGATYLFTGNALNEKAIPGMLTLGLGKSAAARAVESLARHKFNNDKNFSFYYVDERAEDGTPMYKGVTADAHAEVFLKLAREPKQGPWQYTFTAASGYKAFAPGSW
ncbi:hypothetical protein F5Y17DRAFT_180882 [Xylariaceae sp. FL0594]|nr:hypothetical protein F5Y17DRAFT_180882 [Xylariaceae sp. FL0594]